MSILSLYQSNSRVNQSKEKGITYSNATPIKITKSVQQDREQLYNSQIMHKALLDSCKKAKENRLNSPTFKVTDTILQENQDAPIIRQGKKQSLFSGIDSQINPQRNVHTSKNKTNVQLMMFNEDHFMKRYNPKQLDIQQEKEYRTQIKVFKQNPKIETQQKRLRKSVPGQPIHKDPILSPDSKIDKKMRMSCSSKIEHKEQSESIKTFKHANSSLGFKDSTKLELSSDQKQQIKMRQSNTFKSEIKNIMSSSDNLLKSFSRTDYKGSDNIKKSTKICLKMDVPRPISAFALYEK